MSAGKPHYRLFGIADDEEPRAAIFMDTTEYFGLIDGSILKFIYKDPRIFGGSAELTKNSSLQI